MGLTPSASFPSDNEDSFIDRVKEEITRTIGKLEYAFNAISGSFHFNGELKPEEELDRIEPLINASHFYAFASKLVLMGRNASIMAIDLKGTGRNRINMQQELYGMDNDLHIPFNSPDVKDQIYQGS